MTVSRTFADNRPEPAAGDLFTATLQDHQCCMQTLTQLTPAIDQAARFMLATLTGRGRILICGNGGSAADAQHFAAELVGRFEAERPALAAIALTTDSSILTALGNDYDFNSIFARQVEALGHSGDVLLAISTSGNSPNVLAAVEKARSLDLKIIALLGRQGGQLKQVANVAVTVAHDVTARIQEAHAFILHYWAARLERGWADRL